MARIDPEKWEAEHKKHVAEYLKQIDKLYSHSADELVKLGLSYRYVPEKGDLFSYDDSKTKKKQAERLLKEMHDKLVRIVEAGIATQWALANEKNDMLVMSLYSDPDKAYMMHNLAALKAYTDRLSYGNSLSRRVWNYTELFEDNIAMALSVGISEGRSAAQISRDVRNYLNEPDKLFRRVRDKFGNLVLSKRAKAYHPGQGVYRSSYQNALRMAQTEINSAYRQSDYERWQQLDFVVGIEIKTSKTHAEWLEKYWKPQFKGKAPEEICDALAGKYPKDFKFIGWHPRCKCYAVAILSEAGEGKKWWEGKPVNEVKDVPDNFKKWMSENKGRIDKANERGTLPYWVKENPKYTDSFFDKTVTDNFDIYKKYGNGGVIQIAKGIEKGSDYNDILTIARNFAEKGDVVKVTTKLHHKDERYNQVFGMLKGTAYERKCPDLIINGIPYEYEGYAGEWTKRKVSNMLSHGLKQSDRVIIDNNKGCSDRYIRKAIMARFNINTPISEIWLYEKGNTILFFKDGKFHKNNGKD